MKTVTTKVKTYNGNANVFFSADGETIGSTSVYYSSDDLDTEEDCDYNMDYIKEKILDFFNLELKSADNSLELDMDTFEFEMRSIAIHVSNLVK